MTSDEFFAGYVVHQTGDLCQVGPANCPASIDLPMP
jgi:hypothetical protein